MSDMINKDDLVREIESAIASCRKNVVEYSSRPDLASNFVLAESTLKSVLVTIEELGKKESGNGN